MATKWCKLVLSACYKQKEMGITKNTRLSAVLAKVKPASKTGQIRLIWPEIAAMRANRLRYRQITEVLQAAEYGYDLQVGVDHLRRICSIIRQEVAAGKWVAPADEAPEVTKSSATLSPLARAREIHQKQNEPIFPKRSVSGEISSSN